MVDEEGLATMRAMMQQNAELIQELRAARERDTARENQLLQQLQQLGQQQQIPSTAVVSSASAVPSLQLTVYSGSTPFDKWALHVKTRVKARGAKPPHALWEIVSALEGEALDVATPIIDQVETYETVEALLRALRDKFVSPAHKHQARARFESRVQQRGESVKVFHGLLQQLFHDAYDVSERNMQVLIEHFIAGLQDRRINLRIHEMYALGTQPTTYAAALEQVLALMAEYKRSAMETERVQSRGRGHWE